MKRKPLIICLAFMIICSLCLIGVLLNGFINVVKFLPNEIDNKDYIFICILWGIGVCSAFLFLFFSLIFIRLLVKKEHILLTQEEIEQRKQLKKLNKIKKLQNDIKNLKKDGDH